MIVTFLYHEVCRSSLCGYRDDVGSGEHRTRTILQRRASGSFPVADCSLDGIQQLSAAPSPQSRAGKASPLLQDESRACVCLLTISPNQNHTQSLLTLSVPQVAPRRNLHTDFTFSQVPPLSMRIHPRFSDCTLQALQSCGMLTGRGIAGARALCPQGLGSFAIKRPVPTLSDQEGFSQLLLQNPQAP